MKRMHLTAVLVGLGVVAIVSTNVQARYNPGMNVYPAVGTPMPGAQMRVFPPTSPMMAVSMKGGMPAPVVEGWDSRSQRLHISMNIYPEAPAAMPPVRRDSMYPPILFDPTGQHPDGPNLYQYVRSNPVRWQDPKGTNIYLKTGNNSGNALNDAIHQNVCVDTCDDGQKGIACFSFGYNESWQWVGIRGTWLGWGLAWWETAGSGRFMQGEIYEAEDAGTVNQTKETTADQDRR